VECSIIKTSNVTLKIPAVTFIEGPSDIVVPTQSFKILAGGGLVETLVVYQTCTLEPGGIAKCLVSEKIAYNGKTEVSQVMETVTVNAVALTGAGAIVATTTFTQTVTPTPSQSPSGFITSTTSTSTSTTSSASSALSITTIYEAPTGTGAPTGGTLSNDAQTLKYAPRTGFLAVLGGLLMLL
jgi:hypothetical protein